MQKWDLPPLLHMIMPYLCSNSFFSCPTSATVVAAPPLSLSLAKDLVWENGGLNLTHTAAAPGKQPRWTTCRPLGHSFISGRRHGQWVPGSLCAHGCFAAGQLEDLGPGEKFGLVGSHCPRDKVWSARGEILLQRPQANLLDGVTISSLLDKGLRSVFVFQKVAISLWNLTVTDLQHVSVEQAGVGKTTLDKVVLKILEAVAQTLCFWVTRMWNEYERIQVFPFLELLENTGAFHGIQSNWCLAGGRQSCISLNMCCSLRGSPAGPARWELPALQGGGKQTLQRRNSCCGLPSHF